MTNRARTLEPIDGPSVLDRAAATRVSSGSPFLSARARRKNFLDLSQFQPRSMLKVPETHLPRSRFPVIDVHTHLSWTVESKNGVAMGEKIRCLADPEDLLKVMERKNVRTMVNLTGGVGAAFEGIIRKYHSPHPDRFLVFVEPHWCQADEPHYSQFQAEQIVQARRFGASGLKVLKTLGLYLRERITAGPLVKVDDRRFDLMWEVCGALNMPVTIHVSDPEAFFLPVDHYNERFEELRIHPEWSFCGRDFPSNAELLEARNRVFARHPKTNSSLPTSGITLKISPMWRNAWIGFRTCMWM